MTFIAIGVLGFVCFLIFDLFTVQKKHALRYAFALLGIGLIAYSTIRIIAYPSDLELSTINRAVGLIFGLFFAVMTVYSVLIEVRLSYQRHKQLQLITNGTYSLVRHPGVIWPFLAYFFAAMYVQNSYLLISAFIWTFVNSIYIMIQERLILRKLFDDYESYILTTPMLIPNYASIKRFLTLQNWRRE